MEIAKIVILGLSGLLLLFVGTMRLSNPVATYEEKSGIKLPNDANLLNEMRGVSALMLCAGILILLGTIFPSFSFTSFVIGALVFVGFLIGRLISNAADGKPSKEISQGIVFELILGAANLFGVASALM